jgi:hypothetical protein
VHYEAPGIAADEVRGFVSERWHGRPASGGERA